MKLAKTAKVVFDRMVEFENALSQVKGAKFGDDCAPLRHFFGDNLYIREITMPTGMVVVSKIHKTNCPYFIMRGDVSVIDGENEIRIKGPYWGMTKAGTKRILRIHEETVWITVHATKETDLKLIEAEVIAENYDALPDHIRREIEGDSKCLSQQ